MDSCAAFSCLPVSFFFFRGSGMGQIIILSMDWSKLQAATVQGPSLSKTTKHTIFIYVYIYICIVYWMIQFNSSLAAKCAFQFLFPPSACCCKVRVSQGRPWGVKHSPKPNRKYACRAFNKYKYHRTMTSVNIIYKILQNTIPSYSFLFQISVDYIILELLCHRGSNIYEARNLPMCQSRSTSRPCPSLGCCQARGSEELHRQARHSQLRMHLREASTNTNLHTSFFCMEKTPYLNISFNKMYRHSASESILYNYTAY